MRCKLKYRTDIASDDSGGRQARSKAPASGAGPSGVRGFKSHPPHHTVTLPRVSVIILALNEAENIVHCIRSIRDQGYPDVEIVVSDGGSTDGTVELAERLADRVVLSLIHI